MKFAKDTENLNKKFHTTLTVHFTWIYHNAQAVKGLKFFYDFRDIDFSLLLGAVWIHILHVHVLCFPFLFFLFFYPQLLTFLQCTVHISTTQVGPVHCSRDLQISLFSNFFIKNKSHSTIHIFKNYFATMFSVFSFQFSVFSKISCIQTDLNRGIFLDYLSCSLFLIFWARK